MSMTLTAARGRFPRAHRRQPRTRLSRHAAAAPSLSSYRSIPMSANTLAVPAEPLGLLRPLSILFRETQYELARLRRPTGWRCTGRCSVASPC